MQAKKAIFLGVRKFHSNKKNQDYRSIDLYTPPFKDERGYEYGGVQTFFTDLASKMGEGIEAGALVLPEFSANPYSGRSDLVGLKQVAPSPYDKKDFD